jgi:excisionase family DNA binding protein
MMDEILYDIQEFARRLDISNATAYKIVKKKQVRSVRVGSRYRITKSAVDEFLYGGGSSGQGRTEEQQAA